MRCISYRWYLLLLICLNTGCAVDHTLVTGTGFNIEGQGEVVVVLESGAGDGPDPWRSIRPELAKIATVVSYDRPRWMKTKVTGDEVATHLQQLLQQHQLSRPLVLVGHSIGGPFVLSFAKKFPTQVKGIVLVDGRPTGFTEACQQAKGQMCDVPQLLKLTLPLWVAAEVNGLPETYQQHQDYKDFPAIPVVVLSATTPPMFSDEIFMRVWLEKQQQLAQKFTMGTFIAVPDTGHYIHQEKPALVIAEIAKIVMSQNQAEANSVRH